MAGRHHGRLLSPDEHSSGGYLGDSYAVMGVPLSHAASVSAAIGALLIAWGLIRKNSALEAQVMGVKREAEVRRRAANWHDTFAELHGDFKRGYKAGNEHAAKREELRSRIINVVHQAH